MVRTAKAEVEMERFAIVLTWMSADLMTGELKARAAVWKRIGTEASIATAEAYAKTIEGGAVHVVTGPFKLKEFREKAAADHRVRVGQAAWRGSDGYSGR
jgi:hypothetical protein